MKRHKNGELHFDDFPEFRPNLTPQEIFERGSFGGTYWRPIYSSVTGKNHRGLHKKYMFLRKVPAEKLTGTEYDKSINKYGVKVGTSLEYWEEHDWIVKSHPYGWVHWYCDFYSGKRCVDDERQVKRWKALASKDSGRFRRRLDNMIKNGEFSDAIAQTLQHWGVGVGVR